MLSDRVVPNGDQVALIYGNGRYSIWYLERSNSVTRKAVASECPIAALSQSVSIEILDPMPTNYQKR